MVWTDMFNKPFPIHLFSSVSSDLCQWGMLHRWRPQGPILLNPVNIVKFYNRKNMFMAQFKTTVSLLLTHWRYCSLALSHRCVKLRVSHWDQQTFLQRICRGAKWIWKRGRDLELFFVRGLTVYEIEDQHNTFLIHWGRMTHIWVGKLVYLSFKSWLVAFLAPSHYLS